MRPAEWVSDGQVTTEAGVNSAIAADLISQSQCAWMENAEARGGKPKRRPVFVERARLPSGVFNGAALVRTANGRILAGFNGVLYQMAAENDFIPRVVSTGSPMNPQAIFDFAETDQHVIVGSSGRTPPLIYTPSQDAAYARRYEVPPCQAVAYGNGRVWAAQDDKLFAGDIFQPNVDRSELRYDEIKYWAGGGSISFPSRITALAFMPASDSTTGFGLLLVFGATWTHAIRADIDDRLLWAQTPNFRTIVLPTIGCRSSRSVTIVNQDVYFRDQFGELRSIRQAVLDMESAGSSPVSREVSRLFSRDSSDFLASASLAYWDNRLLITSSGRDDFLGPSFDALAVLDFAPISSMQGKSPPAWFGAWTGYRFVQVFSGRIDGVPRCFAIVSDGSEAHRLLEIVSSPETYDVTGETETPVSGAIETRAFDMTNRFTLKRLQRADIYLSDLLGDVNVKVKLRTDHNPNWVLWDEWSINVDETDVPDAGYVMSNIQDEVVGEDRDAVLVGLTPDLNYEATSFANIEDPVIPAIAPQYLRVKTYSPNPPIITASPLVVGGVYRVKSSGTNTNFTPVGAPQSNVVGMRFIATATDHGSLVWDGAELERQDRLSDDIDFLAEGDVFSYESAAGIDLWWGAGSVIECSRGAVFDPNDLDTPLDYTIRDIAPQYRVRLKTRALAEVPADGQTLNVEHGFVFQLRVEVTGANWAIDRIQLFAQPLEDSPFAFSDRVITESTRSLRDDLLDAYVAPITDYTEQLVDEEDKGLVDEEDQPLRDN
jgi:hypothetical protein